MSERAIEQILGRSVMDEEFRILLFAAPVQALAGYDLTVEEKRALLAIDAETLDAFSERLGEHLSRRGHEMP
jgi:hypothetical protein